MEDLVTEIITNRMICRQLTDGLLANLARDPYPSTVHGWNERELQLDYAATHFGIVLDGTATIRTSDRNYEVGQHQYFAVPGPCSIVGGRGLVCSRSAWRGFFCLGGPAERNGRLRYIDGCSDSLLISPVLKGDPCLNLLRIPRGIDQTAHTHPSHRIGLIVAGHGLCRTNGETLELRAGCFFVLPADCLHSFHTPDDELRIIVYHPDSDFGPSDDNHPMLNRTIVDGTSASRLDHIRTQDIESP